MERLRPKEVQALSHGRGEVAAAPAKLVPKERQLPHRCVCENGGHGPAGGCAFLFQNQAKLNPNSFPRPPKAERAAQPPPPGLP